MCVRVSVCLSVLVDAYCWQCSSVREGLACIGIRLSLVFCLWRVDAPLKLPFEKALHHTRTHAQMMEGKRAVRMERSGVEEGRGLRVYMYGCTNCEREVRFSRESE